MVNDTAELAKVVERVREYFGFGDEGRILEVENMYAQPKAHNVSPEGQANVAKMFDEAAALEQIENRGLNNG